MGIIVLIIAMVIEISFVIYCIVTKSNQRRIKSFVRIGAFSTFVIFALVSVIKWSTRWKALALLLLIWAILGVWSLIRNKKDKKEYKARRIVLKAIGTLILVTISITPALIFPQYELPNITGDYEIVTATYTYTDKSRIETFNDKGENREVNVEFWYPQNADGTYPLVVFSHGSFGVKTSNTSTYMELASNGYVVCSIDHPYHSMLTVDADGRFTMVDNSFLQEVLDCNNGVYNEEENLEIHKKWMKVRTEDMNFVVDTIVKNAEDKSSDKVYQLINTDKIGLMGHSLGGATSAQVARERKDIDAVIDIDGEMDGEYVDIVNSKPVLNDKVYPVPILNFYSEDVMLLLKANTDCVYPNKVISKTASDAYEVYIKGTNHMSFTDMPLVSPFIVNMINGSIKNSSSDGKADKYYVIEKMNSIVLEFFDCYLKNKGSFNSAGTY